MTLSEIESAVYDVLSVTGSDSAVVRRIRRYINNAHRSVLCKKGFETLRFRTMPVTCLANNPLMWLPPSIASVRTISDRNNNRNLDKISLFDVRYRDPGQKFSNSIPDSYAEVSRSSPVAQDPLSGSTSLYVLSDSVADGGGLTAYVEGVTANGYPRVANMPMNGTTPVNVDAMCSTWMTITKFYISGLATGNVTLLDAMVGGNELARIVRGSMGSRYLILCLSPIPATAQTYYCDVKLRITDMVNPSDEPIFLEDYEHALISGALRQEYKKREKLSEFQAEDLYWREMVADMGAELRSMGGPQNGGQRGNNRRGVTQFNSPDGAIF